MNVGVWIRVSTEHQKETESPEIHKLSAQRYCQKNQFQIINYYDLSGISGKSVIGTPKCKQMFKDIATGAIRGLVFSSISRLGRNLRELLEIEAFFREHGATLHSIDGTLDTSTPSGRMFFALHGIMAQSEREQGAARVAASVQTRLLEGRKISGQQPFGYIWKDKYNLTIDEEKAPIVRKAFDLFIQHQKIKRVITLLNDAGYYAKKSPWSPKSMKRLLVNEIYTGTYHRNYSRSLGNKKSWKLKPREEWITLQVDPIIPQTTWDTVQNILATRPQLFSKGVPREGQYLFSGVLVCQCGKKLYVTPYKSMLIPRYTCKSCKNKISEDILIEKFLPVLHSIVVNPADLIPVNDNEELFERRSAELKVLKSDTVKNDNRIDKLFELYTDDRVNKETFTARHNPLEERKQSLVAEIVAVESELVRLRQTEAGRQHIVSQAMSLAAEWIELREDERRRIVRVLLDRVEVGSITGGRQAVKFVFAFDPATVFGNLPPTDNGSSKKGAHPQGFMAATSMTRAG